MKITALKTTQANLSAGKSWTLLFLSLFVATLLTGCHRTYRDNQLVGSWLLTTNKIKQTYTFTADHQLTIRTESTKNLALFCDWALTNDQLVLVIRSNSWAPNAPVYHQPATIGKLTDSTLVLKDRDQYDNPREQLLTKQP